MADDDYNNDMMTSFSNPNYTLNDPDALNQNIPLTSDFCDNDVIYGDPDLSHTGTSRTNASSKRRKKYGDLKLGLDADDSSLMVHNDLCSPDSVASDTSTPSGGDADGDSSAASPLEKTAEILEVEHTEPGTDDDEEEDESAPLTSGEGGGTQSSSQGFLGYYASLESSAAARRRREEAEAAARDDDEEKGDEDEEGENDEDPTEMAPLVAVERAATGKIKVAVKTEKRYDDKATDINSPDSNDSGIQADVQHVKHVRGPVNNDIYAVIDRSAKPDAQRHSDQDQPDSKGDDNDDEEREPPLPPGWEKHEDEDGAYYWHIKSGTIQRDPPAPLPKGCRETKRSTSSESNAEPKVESTDEPQPPASTSAEKPELTSKTPLTTAAAAVAPPPVMSPSVSDTATSHELEIEPRVVITQGNKSRSVSPEKESETEEKRIRFAVRSLGWVRIAEEDLTPERSSKAVNKCIVNLSLGRNDINDVVGRWGDGKDLFMDLDSEHLTLIDPKDMSFLNIQPIQSIRVWGVGRDNGRDFAYVARDRMTRKHMCHVFRCDTPARQIANTLRDICKRIMVERSLQQGSGSVGGAQANLQKMSISRPTNLPDLNKDHNGQKLTFQTLYKNTSFPTPMEEPKKVMRCHYLGSMQVTAASGVEVIDSAMEKAYSRVPPEKWVFVSVGVAPSTITIIEHGTENVLAECRVRFLSFMGIAMRNVKMCAFIMHTAQDIYMCHIFHSEPSAGALCKTIEAACKLRYQKCLDAHPQSPSDGGKKLQSQQKQTISATIKASTATLKAGVQQSTASLKAGVQNSTASLKAGVQHSTTALKAGVQNVITGFLKKKPEKEPELEPLRQPQQQPQPQTQPQPQQS